MENPILGLIILFGSMLLVWGIVEVMKQLGR